MMYDQWEKDLLQKTIGFEVLNVQQLFSINAVRSAWNVLWTITITTYIITKDVKAGEEELITHNLLRKRT